MAPRWLATLWTKDRPLPRRRRRPKRQRIERYFECNWVGAWGEEETRVRSISPTGCYIDSRFTVPPTGTRVPEIRVALPDGCITVQGTVLDAMPGVGFAVRFLEVDQDTRARLRALVAAHASQSLLPAMAAN